MSLWTVTKRCLRRFQKHCHFLCLKVPLINNSRIYWGIKLCVILYLYPFLCNSVASNCFNVFVIKWHSNGNIFLQLFRELFARLHGTLHFIVWALKSLFRQLCWTPLKKESRFCTKLKVSCLLYIRNHFSIDSILVLKSKRG